MRKQIKIEAYELLLKNPDMQSRNDNGKVVVAALKKTARNRRMITRKLSIPKTKMNPSRLKNTRR